MGNLQDAIWPIKVAPRLMIYALLLGLGNEKLARFRPIPHSQHYPAEQIEDSSQQ